MRKIFFLSIILFLLVGCTKSEPIEQVKINQLVSLSDEPKAIKVTLTISDFEFLNDVNDIEIGIIYKQNAMIDEVNNFSIDTLNITKINQAFNQKKVIDFYISNILEEDYQKMFTIRDYFCLVVKKQISMTMIIQWLRLKISHSKTTKPCFSLI